MQFLSHHSFIEVCPCQGPIALQPPEDGDVGAEVVVVTGEVGVEVVTVPGVTGPEVVVAGGFVPLLSLHVSMFYKTVFHFLEHFWNMNMVSRELNGFNLIGLQ